MEEFRVCRAPKPPKDSADYFSLNDAATPTSSSRRGVKKQSHSWRSVHTELKHKSWSSLYIEMRHYRWSLFITVHLRETTCGMNAVLVFLCFKEREGLFTGLSLTWIEKEMYCCGLHVLDVWSVGDSLSVECLMATEMILLKETCHYCVTASGSDCRATLTDYFLLLKKNPTEDFDVWSSRQKQTIYIWLLWYTCNTKLHVEFLPGEETYISVRRNQIIFQNESQHNYWNNRLLYLAMPTMSLKNLLIFSIITRRNMTAFSEHFPCTNCTYFP